MIKKMSAVDSLAEAITQVEGLRRCLPYEGSGGGVARSIEAEISKRLKALEEDDDPAGNIFQYLSSFVSDYGFDPPLADEPTDHPAGSAEKIKIMMERVDSGKAIFHPDDRKISDGVPSWITSNPYPHVPFKKQIQKEGNSNE